MVFPEAGSGSQGSELDLLTQDMVSGMGDFIASNVGSLAWCEAYAIARMLDAGLSFVRLLGAQAEPALASIYLNPMYRNIFINAPAGDDYQLLQFIQQLTLQTGTPPTYTHVLIFLQNQLGQVFLTLEWIPLQKVPYATFGPPATGFWNSPVSNIMVHCWQPRDKNDNILLPYSVWIPTLNSWQNLVQNWVPANCFIYNVVPSNAGGDGTSTNTFQDGYNNPVNVVSGSKIVNSTLASPHSTFETDFISVFTDVLVGQIFEIVDDNNVVQTYYVESVQSNTQLTLLTPAISNCTARTYRTFGFRCNLTQLGPTAVIN
jgi:hypothetical protein